MGHLRGQRNRKSDRYWQDRRKWTQSGMVGAMDVPECMFCGHLVASIDACSNDFGDVYCRSCGIERGLIETIKTRAGIDELQRVDAISYEEGVTGRSGRSKASVTGFSAFTDGIKGTQRAYRRTQTLERFERELEREQAKAARAQQRESERETLRAEREQAKAARARSIRRADFFRRAMLWLKRDKTVKAGNEAELAFKIANHPVLEEAREAIRVIRMRVYRQQFSPQDFAAKRKVTDDQAIAIRQLYALGGSSFVALGREYGVTGACISQIVTGSTYKHVGGPIHIPNKDRALVEVRRWMEEWSSGKAEENLRRGRNAIGLLCSKTNPGNRFGIGRH